MQHNDKTSPESGGKLWALIRLWFFSRVSLPLTHFDLWIRKKNFQTVTIPITNGKPLFIPQHFLSVCLWLSQVKTSPYMRREETSNTCRLESTWFQRPYAQQSFWRHLNLHITHSNQTHFQTGFTIHMKSQTSIVALSIFPSNVIEELTQFFPLHSAEAEIMAWFCSATSCSDMINYKMNALLPLSFDCRKTEVYTVNTSISLWSQSLPCSHHPENNLNIIRILYIRNRIELVILRQDIMSNDFNLKKLLIIQTNKQLSSQSTFLIQLRFVICSTLLPFRCK